MRETKWEWKIHHVYGHQDQNTAYHELDLWAQLNVDCNIAAGYFQEIAEWNNYDPQHIPLYKALWKIHLANYNVTSDIQAHTYQHVHKNVMFAYWSKHKTNPGNALSEVNWDAGTLWDGYIRSSPLPRIPTLHPG